jgi:membrane fusion protein, heavy metal efflux system
VKTRPAALLLLVLLVAARGCRSSAAAEKDPAPPRGDPTIEGERLTLADGSPQIEAVTSAAVSTADADSVRLNGRVVWNEDVTVRIFSPFAGRVMRVPVGSGEAVRSGDLLAEIASPDLGQAQADASRAETDLALAERTLRRMRDLFDHGVVAEKEVFAADADLARARAEQQRARGRLALYGVDSMSAHQAFFLRAPFDGVVVERNVTAGQEVRPDQMLANAPQLFAPLFVVTDPTRLWVLLDLPERDVSALRQGIAVRVRADAWPDRLFDGKVMVISSAVDPATRTLKVRCTLDNPARLLRAEMLVHVDVPGVPGPRLAVPAAAVLLQGDAHVVYVEESRGHYRRVEVAVGPESGGAVPVLRGLRSGDRVVTSGTILLEQLFRQVRS